MWSAWVCVSTTCVICRDRKSTRLNSSHSQISYAVFCLKKKERECVVDLDLDLSKHVARLGDGGCPLWSLRFEVGRVRSVVTVMRGVVPRLSVFSGGLTC